MNWRTKDEGYEQQMNELEFDKNVDDDNN